MKGLKLVFTKDGEERRIQVDKITAIDASVDGMLIMTAANGGTISISTDEFSKMEAVPEE